MRCFEIVAAGMIVIATGTASAADAEAPRAPELETMRRSPTIRAIPNPQRFRFEPKADMTAQELEQLGPYLKGKPLYDEDRKALGAAMRHLKEVN
jgi:hypothetical protein